MTSRANPPEDEKVASPFTASARADDGIAASASTAAKATAATPDTARRNVARNRESVCGQPFALPDRAMLTSLGPPSQPSVSGLVPACLRHRRAGRSPNWRAGPASYGPNLGSGN